MAEDDWRAANLASWNERVAVHLAPGGYDLGPLRAGKGRLDALVEAELGPVAGLRVLHLQCHFGKDTLTLLQQGAASAVGLDFSDAAIAVARGLAAETNLAGRARFVEADLYDATAAVADPGGFDLVFVTWGALCWLPDITGWARIVARHLRPGGRLYLAEGHPAALVFEDRPEVPGGMLGGMPGEPPDAPPGWYVPYFGGETLIEDDARDYANPTAKLTSTRTHSWMHPLSDVLGALAAAGLTNGCTSIRGSPGACSGAWCGTPTASGPGRTGPGCRCPTRCPRTVERWHLRSRPAMAYRNIVKEIIAPGAPERPSRWSDEVAPEPDKAIKS